MHVYVKWTLFICGQLAFFLPPLRSFHSATSAGVNVSAFLYETGGYHCGRNHNQ